MSQKALGAAIALALTAVISLSSFAQAGVEWTRVRGGEPVGITRVR